MVVLYARNWEGGQDPIEYVATQNLYRRQLSEPQRAYVAAKILTFWSDLAKERQRKAGKETNSNQYTTNKDSYNNDLQLPANLPEAAKNNKDIKTNKKDFNKGDARDQAAKIVNVSGRSVSDAKTVLDKGNEEKDPIDSATFSVIF
jgi:hypothetical protein